MIRVLRAEWTKLSTMPATGWLVLAIAALTVLASALASGTAAQCPSPATCFGDSTRLALSGVWLGQTAAVTLGVLVVSNEHSTSMARTTLVVTPRRLRVLLAKSVAVAAVVGAAGTVGVLGSLVAGRALLPRGGLNAPTGGYVPVPLEEPTLRAAAGSVLYLVLVALLAVGVAAVLRDTAAALSGVLALLFAAPALGVFVSDPQWHERLQQLSPMTAGLAVQSTMRLYALPIGPWAGLGVLAGYAAAAVVAGAVLVTRRDA
ncbi:ABC-2 type transport system permease protein [Lipingzhangella halophila]|uniref:ABC-2 type transport system permease protein n=1 Tax=Lipingzhangella halophila TaxID=1783352 RepID=A0A7W7W2U7_9ACTN|nr:ABC transporter permease [Lipingzhangella halophila]MBB4932352.1 ABC-2 type transport system permease protein [Lipingzhangella halophila]